jgi:hypothetical protein
LGGCEIDPRGGQGRLFEMRKTNESQELMAEQVEEDGYDVDSGKCRLISCIEKRVVKRLTAH